MTLRLPVLVLLTTLGCARADLVVVQKAEGSGQSGEQVIKIKGDKARTDLAQQVSLITEAKTGDITTLMHTQKSFMKMPAAQTNAMLEQLRKARGNEGPAKLQPTGRKEKVGQFDCDLYTTNLGGMMFTYWITKDVPNYANVAQQMTTLQGGSLGEMAKGLMPDPKEFPGIAVKTEMNMQGQKVTTTVLSIKEEPVDAAIFTIPADYKEMTSPALNFGK